MPDVLQTTVDIEHEGQSYTFKIPTIKFRMETAARATDVRQRAYPEGIVNERLGLIDNNTYFFSRCCAFFELYLVKATVSWPYGSEDPEKIDRSKPPAVRFENFPLGRDTTVEEVGGKFEEAIERFRKGGNPD